MIKAQFKTFSSIWYLQKTCLQYEMQNEGCCFANNNDFHYFISLNVFILFSNQITLFSYYFVNTEMGIKISPQWCGVLIG